MQSVDFAVAVEVILCRWKVLGSWLVFVFKHI